MITVPEALLDPNVLNGSLRVEFVKGVRLPSDPNDLDETPRRTVRIKVWTRRRVSLSDDKRHMALLVYVDELHAWGTLVDSYGLQIDDLNEPAVIIEPGPEID